MGNRCARRAPGQDEAREIATLVVGAPRWARLFLGVRRRALRRRLWALLGHLLNAKKILEIGLNTAHHRALQGRWVQLGRQLRNH